MKEIQATPEMVRAMVQGREELKKRTEATT